MSLLKVAVVELEDIFTAHHKNENICHMVLEALTNLLVVFKEHPGLINDWDRFLKNFILWGCKQKYSPTLTVKLLSFYEQFYEVTVDEFFKALLLLT